jgi:hypothetical protein
VTALDDAVAAARRLVDRPVLFVGHGRFCGPGAGVLLMHRAESDQWELPSTDGAADLWLEGAEPFGDVLLARVDTQFEPAPSTQYDDHCWTSPEYAVGCTANHPSTTAVLRQFLASQGDLTGDLQMDSAKDFIDAQAKAEPVYQAFGDAEGAPARLNGETRRDYRIRLLAKYQAHSKVYKDADLSKVQDETVFSAIENAIWCDAMQALRDPATFKRGVLIPQVTRDAAGRSITRYIGQDGACWDQFNPPIRHVRRINVPGSARVQ